MGKPRYLEVASILQRRISDGQHPVGSLLPTETELCRAFAVSRHTVREALRALREMGLITRRQGAGTQVVASETPGNYTQSVTSIADVLQYARGTYLELGPRQEIAARGAQARLLRCAPGRPWLKYVGLRRAGPGGQAICATDLYIDPAFADIETRFGSQPGAIYELIEEMYGEEIAEIRQEISAVVLSPEVAAALDAEPGEPALRIVRRYLGTNGSPLEVSVSIHPADRFTYAMRLRRDAAGPEPAG